jgi:prepilin-type N-terminal cleavage/methylation domain-containing protein
MKKAFTLLETMIVIAIIAVLGVVAFFSLQGGKSETDLTGTIQQMTTLLRQAQSSAVSQKTSHRLHSQPSRNFNLQLAYRQTAATSAQSRGRM